MLEKLLFGIAGLLALVLGGASAHKDRKAARRRV